MAANDVSEIFDPTAWREVPGFEDLTDLTYHRAVEHGTVRIAFDRPEVRNAFRPRHRRRAAPRARARPDVQRRRLRAAHRQRPVAQGRRLGVLLRRRPADPRPGRLPVRRGRDRGDRRQGQARPAAHPRVPAADPLHAQDRDLRGARLGRRRRAQPARRVRPHAGQRASTPGSSRPTPTSARFDGGFGSAYLARQVGQKFAREIFFLGDEYTAEDAHRMGMVNRGRRPRRPGARGAGVGPQDQRQVARPRSGC